MATKVFKTLGNLRLVGDERDVMVSARHRLEVLDWCDANEIDAEISMGSTQSAWSASTFGVNLWRVRDKHQRVMFILRWT